MSGNKHYIGLDVHKDAVTIAVTGEDRGGEVRIYDQMSGGLRAVEKVLRKIGSGPGTLPWPMRPDQQGLRCSGG